MKLLLLTPAPDEPRFASVASELAGRLIAPLRPVGIEVTTRPWTEALDFAGFDAVTPLLAWSYHLREAEWRALLDRIEAAGVTAVNPLATLAWNTQKTYLAELQEAGAPVAPTLFVDRLTPAAVAEAHERFGPDLMVKPQVSGGSYRTIRLRPGGELDGGPTGPAMLQPFLPSVAEEGELSLLYFGGAFSHAIVKRPGAGDFRVQYQYGGAYSAIGASPEMLNVAEQVLAAADQPLAYARIDLIRAPDGALKLVELEAIEPDLYLGLAPDGGAMFAKTVRAAMG